MSAKPAARKPSPLHPRNRHQHEYDFDALCRAYPALTPLLRTTPRGNRSIDFTDPQAVKTLNQALLMHWYGIQGWEIPDGFLCPPIPGRADYIHYLADLLASANGGKRPAGARIRALDIGCGANCIYPLVGHSEYGWLFSASDIDPQSMASAQRILEANPALNKSVRLIQQTDSSRYFSGVLQPAEFVDLTLCNPPFHDSQEQMERGNRRKWKNLEKWDENSRSPLNFGGQSNELWCDGGEAGFINRMIRESRQFGSQVYWFTSLVSKQATLPLLEKALREAGVVQQQVVEMAQGQKSSRFIAWSFLNPDQQKVWRQLRWGSKA